MEATRSAAQRPAHGLQSLAIDTSVYGLARVLVSMVGVLLVPVYTRFLTPADYGVLENLAVLGYFVLTVFDAALPVAVVQRYIKTDDELDRHRLVGTAALCTFTFGGVAILVGLGTGEYLGGYLVRRGPTENLVLLGIALAGAAMTVQTSLFLSVFRARFDRRRYLWATLGPVTLTVVLSLVLIVGLRLGVAGAVLARTVGGLLSVLYCLGVLRDSIRIRHFSFPLLRQMLVFGSPFAIGAVMTAIIRSSDRYFISALVADPLPKIGLYSMAEKCMAPLQLATAAFGLAWAPFALTVSRQADAQQVHIRTFKLYVTATAFLVVALSMLAPIALRILATAPYYPSARFTPAVGLYLSLYYLTYIGSLGLLLKERSGALAPIVATAAAVNIALNLLWIPRWEVMGAIWATVVSVVIHNCLIYAVGEHYHRIGFPLARGLAVYGIAYLAGRLALEGPLVGAGALLVFVAVAWLLGFLEVNVLVGLVAAARPRLWPAPPRSGR